MRQRAFQAAFPTFAAVMQIGASPANFTGRVHLHPFGRAHDAHHLPLGQNFTAAHTRALGHMLHVWTGFLDTPSIIPSSDAGGITNILPIYLRRQMRRRRACASCGPQLRQAFFVELKLNTLLLALLAFLLIRRLIFYRLGFGIFPASSANNSSKRRRLWHVRLLLLRRPFFASFLVRCCFSAAGNLFRCGGSTASLGCRLHRRIRRQLRRAAFRLGEGRAANASSIFLHRFRPMPRARARGWNPSSLRT
jgi:hypothetical protein